MDAQLSDLLCRHVDILTRSPVERSPNYIRRKEILGTAEIIYGQDDSYLVDTLLAARKAVNFADGLTYA